MRKRIAAVLQASALRVERADGRGGADDKGLALHPVGELEEAGEIVGIIGSVKMSKEACYHE